MSASNPNVILLFVMLGATAAVCCAWAVTHYWTDANEGPELFEPSASQALYMREVRERGRDMLWQDVLDARRARRGNGNGNRKGSSWVPKGTREDEG
ncbi:hypothetical protein N7G274_005199 [Stereocaulon virgatum]|uniref:Uncharacterized protein n=1 Tax=Stereocaulon virgatum TaxID=373712 RepID=A0ABR4A9B9_9LECA